MELLSSHLLVTVMLCAHAYVCVCDKDANGKT